MKFLIQSIAVFLLLGTALAVVYPHERTESYWKSQRENDLLESINKFSQLNTNKAKNVIIFIGDGMSIGTTTAGRVYMGQKMGKNGEEHTTTLDQFPHVGTAKTYSVNSQTPDSAATATAILTGVKTANGVLGLTSAHQGKCTTNKDVETALEKAVKLGKSTGVVTTTRIQHATPASAYAHIPQRSWYSHVGYGSGCKDIAQQLFDKRHDIQVLLGGGRVHMHGVTDRDILDEVGIRETGLRRGFGTNLIQRWKDSFGSNVTNLYVKNRQELDQVDPESTDYLLGLFAPTEMEFRLSNSMRSQFQPRLPEMVEKAIRVLRKNDEGFFLLVEGGMIDKAHHKTLVKYALEEFSEFDKAVQVAKQLTSDDDTLIIATADHGHVFTFGNTGGRGTPFSKIMVNNQIPYNTLGRYYTNTAYGNGPNYNANRTWNSWSKAKRHAESAAYQPLTAVKRAGETHSAEDMIVYASGPMSHLITGVHEQTFIAEVVSHAACLNPEAGLDFAHCQPSSEKDKEGGNNGSGETQINNLLSRLVEEGKEANY
uniref:alkaline phosphatase n=1 Tax=Phallusia mammillata TaxID=59560 RepID=A0A6F9DA69_9ASCI|nr:alkaline phosphatase [Phallusia mammillata]